MTMSMSSTRMQVQGLVLVMLVVGLISTAVVKETLADCGSTDGLAACLTAAESNILPTAECCDALATYLTADTSSSVEDCLCEAATGPAFADSGADAEYAITIPEKCNLTFAAGTECNGVVIPGGQ